MALPVRGSAGRVRRSTAILTALAFAGLGSTAPAFAEDGEPAPNNQEQQTAEAAIVPLAAEDEVTLNILSINDFHGRIENSGQSAGGAVLSCAVNDIRADNPNTLFVSAGDNIGASTFTSFISDDVPTIDVLNEIGLDVSAFGNHEFDKGQDDVNNRLVGPDKITNFDYIGANIYRNGTRAYEPFSIKEIGGVRVGFIGALTPEVPSLVTPAGITGLEFRDPLNDVNEVAAQLTDGDDTNGEADVVVVLVHDGAPNPDLASANGTAFGDLVDGVSDKVTAIISGHTHQAYVQDANGVWVTQTGQYGENLGNLSVTYDTATGKVTDSTAQNIDLVGANDTAICAGDANVQTIVDAAKAKAEELGSRPVGDVTADLLRARQSDGSENRGGESTLGNAVADVQLWAAKRTNPDAQIAFMNPGGLRADIAYKESAGEGDGVVTYKEAASVQPFANTLVTTQLTGAQIIQVLEEQWQPASASRPFLKLGVSADLTYTYTPDADPGQHIQTVLFQGEPLAVDATYTVAMNSFLASGGDNFATLAAGRGTSDSGQSDLAAMVDYLDEFGVLEPDYAQRAIGLTWVSDPDATYTAGDEIALDVSSFAFNAGEPVAQELTASLGGVAVGTFALDAAPVDTTDEVGRAEIRIPVPADLTLDGTPGPDGLVTEVLTLEIVDAVNGTSLTVPINVALAPEAPAPPSEEPTEQPTDVTTPPGPGGGPGGPGGQVGPVGPGGPGGPAGTGSLPRTGIDALPALVGVVLLLSLGSGGVILAARKRSVS